MWRCCADFSPVAPKEALHATVELGNKALVAAGCIVGEGSSVGDKSSVKRSVIGEHCKCDHHCLDITMKQEQHVAHTAHHNAPLAACQLTNSMALLA